MEYAYLESILSENSILLWNYADENFEFICNVEEEFGIDSRIVSFTDFVELLSWEYCNDFIKGFDEFLKHKKENFKQNFLLKRKNNSFEFFRFTAKNVQGKIRGFIENINDFKEEILNYDLINKYSSDGVFIFDGQKVTYISESYKKNFMPLGENIVGYDTIKILDHVHTEDRERVSKEIYTAIGSKKTELSYVYRWKISKDKFIWRRDTARYLYDKNGDYYKAIVNCKNIDKEHKLLEELKIFKKAIETTPVSIVITNKNAEIEYANKYFFEKTGYSFEEVQGKNPRILGAKTQNRDFFKQMWNKISNGETWNGEFHNRKKNGEEYWEEATISSIKDDFSNIIKYIAVKKDITHQRSINLELENQKKFFETVLELSTVGFTYIVDRKIVWANKKMEKLFQYEGKDYQGITTERFFKDINVYNSLESSVYEKKEPKKQDIVELKKADGSLFYGEYNYKFIDDESPLKGLIVSITDVTENINYQKELLEAKEKAEESERRFKTLAKNVPGAIYLCNNDKLFSMIYLNDLVEELTGYNKEDFLKDRINFPELYHKDDIDFIYREVEEALKNKSIYHLEYRLKHKSGHYIWIEEFGSGVFENNELLFLEGILFDRTDRHRRSEELLEAKEKAEESNRLKSAFLANISHEIRTPMNGIMGFSQLLLDEELNQEMKYYVEIIRKSATRLLDTIDSIIEISKVDSNEITVKSIEFDLMELLKQKYDFFKPEALHKNIDLIFDNNFKDKFKIVSDKTKVNSIIDNLIKNALKYTDKGTVNFGVNIKEDAFEFYVQDTGFGIEEKYLNEIFDRFTRIHQKEKVIEGNGLGLSIVKSYVDMLGGKINVKSTFGSGSTFTFEIPIKAEEANVK